MLGKKVAVFILVFAALTALSNLGGIFVFTGADMSEMAASAEASAAPAPSSSSVLYNGKEYAPNAGVINILLLGIDSDPTRQSENMGWRSDMMELCTIDLSADTITLTAIPRDTRAEVNFIDKATWKVSRTLTDKVNAAYSYGGGPEVLGAQNAEKCISDLLSVDGKYIVPIDFYISIDLAGIPDFAGALGGVSLPLDVDFPGLGYRGQIITLDQRNAILYLSNRKEVGGDLVRDSHEQQYMIAVAKKIKAQGAVTAASELYPTLLKFMKTNLTLEQILQIAKILDKISLDDVKMQIIQGNIDTIGNVSYFIADSRDIESKVVQLMYSPVTK